MPFSGTFTVLYCATQLCVCSAGLELLELELFLFELVFVVEAVLFFFDSEVFDLFEESAFAVSSFFSSCFTSCSSFFSSSVLAESSLGVKVAVLPSFSLHPD